MADNRSEGGFSGSDSQSSMYSAEFLDCETLKLGTAKVMPLILMDLFYFIVPGIF